MYIRLMVVQKGTFFGCVKGSPARLAWCREVVSD